MEPERERATPLDRKTMLDVLEAARGDLDRVIDSMLVGDAARVSWTRVLAHHVNNLLVSVFFILDRYALALRQGEPAPPSDVFTSNLRMVAERIQETMRRLMVVSQVDTLVRVESVDLREVAADTVQRSGDYAGWKHIRIEDQTGGDTPLLVGADRSGLLEILLNLVGNAIKYSPPGSRVTVRVTAGADTGECRVIDRGPGIPPDDRAKLFQLGVVLGARPTAGEPQTGVGLALSKALADAMRARLWCESGPDDGATFVVQLPRTPDPAPGPSP